ncbi:hypothetical protein REPUB_Repub01dG0020400 [Reevesia pubescens]
MGYYKLSPNAVNQKVESFLLNAINMSFFEQLNLAWKIVFPSTASIRKSNANIAKQRLKMILFSDRCAVSFKDSSVIRYATRVKAILFRGKLTVERYKSDKVWFTARVKKSRPKDAYETPQVAVKVDEF